MVGEDGAEFRDSDAQERLYRFYVDVDPCGDLCVAEILVACAQGGGVCIGKFIDGRGSVHARTMPRRQRDVMSRHLLVFLPRSAGYSGGCSRVESSRSATRSSARLVSPSLP